jgi:outer membrane protein OmpA-like peptidoglycan-associated protein
MEKTKKHFVHFWVILLGLWPGSGISQPVYSIERLPNAINSRYEEIKPITSSGGDSLFFIRSYCPLNSGGEYAGEDIWLSVFLEGKGWSEATNTFGYPNHPGPDIFIRISRDGRSFYTLDYMPSGQNRFINIIRKDLFNSPSTEKSRRSFDRIEIGNDYHDLYINTEGTVLFISMNALNSIGLEDLYVSQLKEDGGWTDPLNLGPVINTRGFEISPFLTEDGRTLYFASNGHEGLGDADIFYSHRLDTGWQNWSRTVNMGPPVNSPHFDAYLSINGKEELFFTSNRKGGYSDIYKSIKQIEPSHQSAISQEETAGLEDSRKEPVDAGFPGFETPFTLFFEFDEFRLSEEELDRLTQIAVKLNSFTDTGIEIYGYTDDTGSESYNLKLSEKRARFVYRYLRKSGIDGGRLYAEGKGIYFTPDENKTSPEKMRVVIIEPEKNK